MMTWIFITILLSSLLCVFLAGRAKDKDIKEATYMCSIVMQCLLLISLFAYEFVPMLLNSFVK